MGQIIEVLDATVLGDVALFDTDRSFTGQDGVSVASGDSTAGIGGELASALFGADEAIAAVYTLSNTLSVTRSGGWDDDSVAVASEALRTFFLFYDE